MIGLSLAWELANRGFRVSVVDAGPIKRAASWAGAGILPPAAGIDATTDPYEQLRSRSHELHSLWAQKLASLTQIDTGFSRCGGIYLARTAAEKATLMANQFWWNEHEIEHRRLDHQQLAALEPELSGTHSSKTHCAWLLPDECQLRNPRHLKALAQACRQSGVHIMEKMVVKQTHVQNRRVAWVECESGLQLRADRFCVCSGAWTRQILDQLEISNGILPVRGQMVLYRCSSPPIHRIINEGHRYLVPRADGRVLAGSVEEEVGFVCETTEPSIHSIRNWAENLLPVLGDSTVERTWAGLRPGSFDGFPYLGAVPSVENLYVASGHFRSGLHLSCATAEVMANLIEGKENQIDLHAFRIGRG